VRPKVERAIVQARRRLRDRSALGEHGAEAIRQDLLRRGLASVPSTRTIGRVLERSGLLDGRRRVRRPPPPPGWHLPTAASGKAELDSFDIVEGLVVAGGVQVEVLNAVSLHGRLAGSWPTGKAVTSRFAVDAICAHWRAHGLPRFAQFDNDTIFQGAHHVADTFGRVTRLCQQLGVTPVFAPPREQGFQAAIERFNRAWQDAVWRRFRHRGLHGLRLRSDAYVRAHREKHASSIDAVPRRAFPARWRLDLRRPLRGSAIFIRRTDHAGRASLLGHTWRVDSRWAHRLVRAEVDLDMRRIRFFALRRRQPEHQPLLREIPYDTPTRPFLDT